jgi:hypothetical protein
MMGDNNFPSMCWESGAMYGRSRESRLQAALLLSFMENFAMEQYVTIPTRLENVLDLVITSNSELIREIVVEDTRLSDHRLLLVTADLGNEQLRSRGESNTGISSLNFMSCLTNWDGITRDLNEINWEQRSADQTAQEVYEDLQRVLLETCLKHTPMKRERKMKIVPRDRRIAMRKKSRSSSHCQK